MRLRITLLLTGLATLALAGPAFSGSFPKLKGSKTADGPFRTDTFLNIQQKRNLYTKILSTDLEARRWSLYEQQGGPGDGDYDIKWFDGDENISHDVQTGGYRFKLKPGQ